MDYSPLACMEILPDSRLFTQREHGSTHTPYETETIFYSCIKNGNCKKVEETMKELLSQKIFVGKMSEDPLREMQYWAVCCVTLAARYAIQGGLDETDAFNFSDECIMKIDRMTRGEDIFLFLQKKSIELTSMVAKSTDKLNYPPAVKKCIHYIKTNLHGKITLEQLADVCSLSPDYLSLIFKKSVGETVSSYIMRKKLEAAVEMLNGRYSTSETAYYLGFCSESYFIKCFKKAYGKTPGQYKKEKKF